MLAFLVINDHVDLGGADSPVVLDSIHVFE